MPRYIDVDSAIHFSRLRYASDLDKEEVAQFIDAAEQTLAADLQVSDLKELETAPGALPADLKSVSAAQLYRSPHYWHLIYAHVNYEAHD